MSMSINIHAKTDENFHVLTRFVPNSEFGHETYGTIQLHGDKIDVCVFVEERELDILITQLQALKRRFKSKNTKKVLDTTTL